MKKDILQELFNISGQVAVVTGGGGVLCSEIARMLASVGVKTAVLDISLDAAQVVADEIRAAGGAAIAVHCDVLDKTSVEQAAGTIIEAFDHVDILINGAGGNKKQATTSAEMSFFDIPADAVQWVFNLNIIGTLLPSQVFGKIMAGQGHGVILNISSMNAYRPLTRVPAYSAAKAAVSNFTQWLAVHIAQEYSPKIRVNAIAPGFLITEQNRFLVTDAETGGLTPRGQKIIDHTPLGRFQTPEELLSTVVWLISPGASAITGIIIPIDGGFSAYSGV